MWLHRSCSRVCRDLASSGYRSRQTWGGLVSRVGPRREEGLGSANHARALHLSWEAGYYPWGPTRTRRRPGPGIHPEGLPEPGAASLNPRGAQIMTEGRRDAQLWQGPSITSWVHFLWHGGPVVVQHRYQNHLGLAWSSFYIRLKNITK